MGVLRVLNPDPNTFHLKWDTRVNSYRNHALGRDSMVRFVLDDETEIHVCLIDNGTALEVRSTGRETSHLVVRPRMANEVIVSTER